MEEISKVKCHTLNTIDENRKKIGELFPEVITESINQKGELVHAIDFEKLKQLLSDSLVNERECYDFTWVGKNKAILEAGQPIEKTLRPLKEKSVDWDNTENVYIEGDNLEVLKLLQESYLNKIDVIYIDPPYNTGNDFIYDDDFKMSEEEYSEAVGEFDEYNQRMIPSKKDNARFHSDWLNMMYSRLKLARNLLSDDGVIFISIDDNEQAHLKELCDEIFGEQNFVANFIWEKKKKPSFLHSSIGVKTEYILLYSKACLKKPLSIETTTLGKKYPFNNAGNKETELVFPPHSVKFANKLNNTTVKSQDMSEKNIKTKLLNDVEIRDCTNVNEMILLGEWRYSQQKLNQFILENRNITIASIPFRPNLEKKGGEIKKMHNMLTRETYRVQTNEDATKEIESIFGFKVFDFTKPFQLIKLLLKSITYDKQDAIILDFFSGSGTTADAVMQLNAEDGGNRKFIMVQLPEKIDEKQEAYKEGYRYITEIGEERIRRAGKKIKEEHPEVDTGFRVFKVDSSNMESTYKTPDKVNQQNLLSDIRNVKEGRNDLDLLYQVMLDWGLELSLPYQVEMIGNTKIHNVFDNTLLACFSDELNSDVIRKMAEKKPLRVVFKDSSFKDSATKINVSEIFKEMSPETKIKVI